MKALKTLFSVLLAVALIAGLASCKNEDDDDDEDSITMNFSYDSATGYYLSQEIDDEGDTLVFAASFNTSESSWAWGLYTINGTSYDYDDYAIFGGTFVQNGSAITLTKTFYQDIFGNNITHIVQNWRTFTIADNGTFTLTVYASDLAGSWAE